MHHDVTKLVRANLLLFASALGWLMNAGGSARAEHPVSVIEADIYVQRFKTTIRLKCFADDLELLQGVEPLEDGTYDSEELHEAQEDHADFLAERIQVFDSDGNRLTTKVAEIVYFDIPEQGIRQGELMNYSMGFQLEISYEKTPEFLTIKQMIVGEGLLLPSELKVLLKQEGSDTPYFQMMKPDMPETFRFDWTKPVLSSDASEKEWNEWFEEQREQTLGITSYSSVYSFIYITAREVRHEILIPLASLAMEVDFDRADPSFLEITEQDAARQKIVDFFSKDNQVTIDGITVQPIVDRVDFYGLDLRDFAVQAERRKISMANGRVGVILTYGAKSPPSEVQISWDLFNDAIKTVDAIIFPYDKVEKTQFSMFLAENAYRWKDSQQRDLPSITEVLAEFEPAKTVGVPTVTVACGLVGLALLLFCRKLLGQSVAILASIIFVLAAAMTTTVGVTQVTIRPAKLPTISEDLAEATFRQLLANVFRAFDYRREEEIYDALARSIDGPLLTELYTQLRKSLEDKQQGGAISRIENVTIESGTKGETREMPGNQNIRLEFDYRSTWNLVGTVEHWGHIHQRTNIYDGLFTVSMIGDRWKITGMRGLDEKQGPVKTSLRKF